MASIYQGLNTSIHSSLDSSITQYTPATMSPSSEISSSSANQNPPFMKPKDLPLVHWSPSLVITLWDMTAI